MSEDIATIGIRADTTDLKRGERALDSFASRGENAEKRVSRASGIMSGAMRSAASAATVMASTLAAAFGLQAIGRGAADVQALTNGFLGMGQSAEQAAASLRAVADIAERTRAPLTATAELYRRVSVAAGELGASQAEVGQFTQNIGMALAASGTSAAQASGALLQLSQAMAGGVVRAEEFNSILEGAFPIAQAAARGIDAAGGSVGRLRQLVVEGKVSSEEFFRAILSQSDAIEQAFGQTVPTVSQAMTALGNAVALTAGSFDQMFGISEGLANGLIFLADNLQLAASLTIAAGAALALSYTPAIISATVATASWVASLVTLRGALMATGIGALVVSAGVLIDYLLRLRQATGSWAEALGLLGEVASATWTGITESAKSIPPALAAVWERMKSSFLGALSDMALGFGDFLQSIADAGQGVPLLEGMFDGVAAAASRARGAARDFGIAAADAGRSAVDLRNEASSLVTSAFDPARAALERLRDVLAGNDNELTNNADAARVLKEELDALSGAGGGGRVKELADDLEKVGAISFDLNKSLASVFTDALMGAKSLSDGLGDLLKQMASMFLNQAFVQILGNIMPSFGRGMAGVNFGGFREAGGPVQAGRAYVVGEKRPELFVPRTSGTILPSVPQSGGGGTVVQVINNTGQPARQERGTLPDGRDYVRTIIGEEIGGGGVDKQMNGRFGNRVVPVRRG